MPGAASRRARFQHPQGGVHPAVAPARRQQVALQHEAAHEGGGGLQHQLAGRGALVQHPVLQHRHPVADRQGFLRIVGHHQATGPAAGQYARQLAPQSQPHLHIQVGEGFIQQHHRGAGGEGPGQGQSLPLAARELMGVAALQAGQPQQLQQPAGPAGVLAAAQAETGIAPGIEMGEEGVVLKHHPHPATLRRQPVAGAGHLPPVDRHAAPPRPLEAGDQPQQGGLAATGRAQQPHQLPLGQGQIDPPQGPFLRTGGTGIAMPQALHPHVLPQGQIRRQQGGEVTVDGRAGISSAPHPLPA